MTHECRRELERWVRDYRLHPSGAFRLEKIANVLTANAVIHLVARDNGMPSGPQDLRDRAPTRRSACVAGTGVSYKSSPRSENGAPIFASNGIPVKPSN